MHDVVFNDLIENHVARGGVKSSISGNVSVLFPMIRVKFLLMFSACFRQ